MLAKLRSRLPTQSRPAGDADARALLELVEELTDRNRRRRNPATEQELVRARHRAGAALVAAGAGAPPDVKRQFGAVNDAGLAEAGASELDGALIRGGIEEHGYVFVPGLIDRDAARRFADLVEDAHAARADPSSAGSGSVYRPFVPDPPYPPLASRAWIERGGGILAADCPPLLFEMVETFERVGLRAVIGEFLGEEPTISVQKCVLRKAEPAAAAGWHQDGSFMGDVRALNVWVALSECGVDAPGLDFVPSRIPDIVPTGEAGAIVAHEVAPQTVEAVAGEAGVVRPRFEPGDVMLFDDRFLHRTGSDEQMAKPRYAIESWFFGASGFPHDYVPLAF